MINLLELSTWRGFNFVIVSAQMSFYVLILLWVKLTFAKLKDRFSLAQNHTKSGSFSDVQFG